jgi:Zn-dependent peptidase ImmA (M78 family)/transcriptional regulator with XRE-family HTH domain
VTLDATRLGKQLAEARSKAGLTQEIVADRVGLPRTALVQLEAGRRSVSTLELAELSRLYQTPIAFFFQSAPPVDEDPLVALGRVSNELRNHPATADSIRDCVALFREGVALERELGREPTPMLPGYAVSARSQGEAAAQGIEAASRERSRLGLGDAPIADLCRLISEQGIWATSVTLPDGFSGLFLNHASIGLAIVVNKAHGSTRKRFSYAHEYAHALFDRERVATVTVRENATELVERRANAFAAAFLMPGTGVESLLRSMHKGGPSRRSFVSYDVAGGGSQESEERAQPGSQDLTFREVASLAQHFGASYAAACYRLRELGFVNKAELDVLLTQDALGRAYIAFTGGDDEKEPHRASPQKDDDEKELVAQLIPLILDAYSREVISRGKVRELARMLKLAESDVLRFAQE